MPNTPPRHSGFGLAAAFVLVALLVGPPATFAADEAAYMTDDERSEMLRLLDESRDLLLGLIGEVSEKQWTWKPAPDRWSVAECAEHIVLSESRLFQSVKGALASPASIDWMEETKGKAELLRRVMPNRNPGGAGGASAPQEIRPQGDLTKADILAEFEKIRTEVREFTEATKAPLKQHIEEHPFPIFGSLNAHDWLIYVPLHTIRHSKQMIEVMQTEGYPKS